MSMKRIIQPLGVLLFSTALFIFTAASASAGISDLTDWAGTWTSSYSYLDSTEMDVVYNAVAAEIDGYDANNVKNALSAMYYTDFAGMEIASGTIKIDSGAADNYTYRDITYGSWGEYSIAWYSFENEDAAADDPFKYILATAAHQDSEDSMLHYHLRYGATGFDDLATNTAYTSWWPTLVESDLTAAEFAQEYLAMKDELVAMFTPVPVPGTICLLTTGLIAIFGFKRKTQF